MELMNQLRDGAAVRHVRALFRIFEERHRNYNLYAYNVGKTYLLQEKLGQPSVGLTAPTRKAPRMGCGAQSQHTNAFCWGQWRSSQQNSDSACTNNI